MSASNGNRIYALDVLRGITVAAMIVVNNAGGKLSYDCLRHSEWSGMTLCDMVFPSFLFIVGLSAYISLSKCGFRWSVPLLVKILRRTLLILLIGWAIHWFECVLKADFLPFGHLRLTGVLPRIALCYFFVSVLALSFRRDTLIVIAGLLLVVYSAILLYGNGFVNDSTNWLSVIDRTVIGDAHLYTKRPIDPEGLVGTVSSVAHTLIGFAFGSVLVDRRLPLPERLLKIMTWGFFLLLAGLALSLAMPLNKRVWSPSFVLVSCALVAMSLAAISYVTDLYDVKRPFRPFDVFGVNPLFLYVLSELTAIVLSATGAKPVIYGFIAGVVPDAYMASAIYSLLFVTVMWIVGYPLFKHKIYIKI